ncbi:hypothetical protein HMI54_001231 [Coelomomyces lativittatus]|nr:hypothetical protein HMI56_006920 [Coelomomyces lativittatus]KAJ1510969.1 hypothetical protein HMI54_001231 [Coelomomyces lativittatus]KAJ1517282.1 hypothetical protein HMI55_000173 [Coelomomyces lativittatus]
MSAISEPQSAQTHSKLPESSKKLTNSELVLHLEMPPTMDTIEEGLRSKAPSERRRSMFEAPIGAVYKVLTQEEAVVSTKFSDHWRGFIGEFMGTLFLLFVTVCVGLIPNLPGLAISLSNHILLQSIAGGFCIISLVFTLADISGAHLNPAITLCLVSVNAFPVTIAFYYWVAQFSGSLVGVALALACLGAKNAGSLAVNSFNPQIVTSAQAFAFELILSSFFFWVVLATGVDTRGPVPKTHLAALPIGLVFGTCVLIGGPLSGVALNPARAFASAAVANEWTWLWIYMVGPLVAASVTGILYKFIFMTREVPQMGNFASKVLHRLGMQN